jgi:hypothetical protein
MWYPDQQVAVFAQLLECGESHSVWGISSCVSHIVLLVHVSQGSPDSTFTDYIWNLLVDEFDVICPATTHCPQIYFMEMCPMVWELGYTTTFCKIEDKLLNSDWGLYHERGWGRGRGVITLIDTHLTNRPRDLRSWFALNMLQYVSSGESCQSVSQLLSSSNKSKLIVYLVYQAHLFASLRRTHFFLLHTVHSRLQSMLIYSRKMEV